MISAFSWQNSISLCPASFCIPRPNLAVTRGEGNGNPLQYSCLLLQVFLDFLLLHSSPLQCKGHFILFFLVLVLESLIGLHRTIQLQLLWHSGWGIDLDYCDIEWFALETNRDHSVIFETVSKYCISDSFVDYDGNSISSKGFLPTVVDIIFM